MSFTYDAENRLMTASKTGLAAAYQYDPLGRRTRKSGTGVTGTFYLSDGTDEIAEYDGTSGTLTTRYIPGPAIDEPVAMVDGATGTKTYFHTNHQGSVIAMSGSGGALAEGPYTYDPYGNCFLGATQIPCTSSGEPYRFTGRRFDPETGLLYYRARYYDPRTGRFNQTDPVGYTADLNLYTYVGNDPTNRTDPTGDHDQITIVTLPNGDVHIYAPVTLSGSSTKNQAAALSAAQQKAAQIQSGTGKGVKVTIENGAAEHAKNPVHFDISSGKDAAIRNPQGEGIHTDTLQGHLNGDRPDLGSEIVHDSLHPAGIGDQYKDVTDKNGNVVMGPSGDPIVTSNPGMQNNIMGPSMGNILNQGQIGDRPDYKNSTVKQCTADPKTGDCP